MASTTDKHIITYFRILFAKNLITPNFTTGYTKLLDVL